MRHVASLDVSLEESAVCVLNGEGDVVGEKKVETEPEAIAAYLSAWSDTLAVVGQEAGGLSPWLHRGLVERGLPAVCIETRRMKAFAKGSPVKTDRRDAKMIAQALLAKLHQEVHVKSVVSHELRMLLTTRKTLLSQARQLENKLRGDLKVFGVKLGRVGSGGFASRVKERLADKPRLMALAAPLLEMRVLLLEQVRRYDRQLRAMARADAVCRRLMTVPGVGVLTALAFRAGIDRPERFRSSASVPAVLGLTPRIEQSGEMKICGSITKAGDPLLRSLLFEAANALLTRTRSWCALKRWGVALAKRRGMNRARVAVARKLAMLLFALWRDGTEFRWTCQEAQSR